MITISTPEVYGFETAIRGMRNPMNSWDKSDSGICKGGNDGIGCSNCASEDTCTHDYDGLFQIGKNDFKLMEKLVQAGPEHAKFMRMISIYMDVTAPLYWWKEFDTYTVGKVVNSCSTMHKIHEKEFTLDDFSHDHVIPINLGLLQMIIDRLNLMRVMYLVKIGKFEGPVSEEMDKGVSLYSQKDIWWQMIQLLPQSYNQKRTVMISYATARNIFGQRCAIRHKLDEWADFGCVLEELPYSELICKR